MRKKHLSIITILLTVVIELLVTLGSVLSNFVSDTLKDTIHPYLSYAFLSLLLVILTGIVLKHFHDRFSENDESPYRLPVNIQNRRRLLARVRNFWIEGVLEDSLKGAALIALGLSERPDAVENPWNLLFQQPGLPNRQLNPGTRIIDVFDRVGEELLLLGAPGSGKTTLLLELARDLLQRALENDDYPMPIIFRLSSWAAKRLPIADWLVEELNCKYQVPRKLGKAWVGNNQILPLLDGLDEVDPGYRAACISAINTYHSHHNIGPIVVCSRSHDYITQQQRLLLSSAVIIQPLTDQQIDKYIEIAGVQLHEVRSAFDNDPTLRELVTTPLMLNVLVMAYHGKSVEDLREVDSSTRQRQIFSTYVQRMLQHNRARNPYTIQQTLRYLSWLAQELEQHDQSVFIMERLQMDWVPNHRFGWLYPSLATGIAYGLFSGVINWLAYRPYVPLIRGLIDGLLIGAFGMLVYVLLNGLLFNSPDWTGKEDGTASGKNATLARGKRIKVMLSSFLGCNLVYGVFNGLLNGVFVGLLVSPVSGLICGLFCSLFYGLHGKLAPDIQPAENISWSWISMYRKLPRFLVAGLLVGLLYGCVTGRFYLLNPEKLLPSFLFGLTVGLVVSLVVSISGGFTNERLDNSNIMKPNQGIKNSARNSLLLGVLFGLTFGMIFWVIFGLTVNWFLGTDYIASFPRDSGIVYGSSDGLAVAAFVWMRCGGTACIQHALLRVLLWRAGYTPSNYQHFLDYATERLLLRKVGGGYIFIHRLLQEHFGHLDSAPASNGQFGKSSAPSKEGSGQKGLPGPESSLSTLRSQP